MQNIAVIGAGIIGICSAFHLQKSGYKVTLFDHHDPGSMTSYGHACTFADYACVPVNTPTIYRDLPSMLLKQDGPLHLDFKYIIRNLPWTFSFLQNCKKEKVEYIASSLAHLLNHSKLFYDHLIKEVDLFPYIKNNETLYLYKNAKEYSDAKYSIYLRKRNGVKIREINASQIYDLEPNIAQIYHRGLVYEGSRHTINPLKFSGKIFESFLSRGGNFIKRKITNLEGTDSFVKIKSENEDYKFDQVIIAAGSWSKELALRIGDKFPLDTERGYHVLFEADRQLINRPVGWSESGFYLVQIEEGIRAAGTVEIAGLEKKQNNQRLKMIERVARKVLPAMGRVTSNWLGFRPTLPDSMPIIGKSNKKPNIIYAFGHQHLGWTLAAVTGKVINDLVSNQIPNINIEPFSPNRFR